MITLQQNQIILEGLHSIKHALRFQAEISNVYTTNLPATMALVKKMCSDLAPQILALISEITQKEFSHLTQNKVRTNLVAVAEMPEFKLEDIFENLPPNAMLAHQDPSSKRGSPIVYLDDPRDLNNLGAVIRVCAAAGVQALLFSGELNQFDIAALRASAGLHFAVPTIKITQNDLFQLSKTYLMPIYGYDDSGQDLLQIPAITFQTPAIHAFGTEREGLSDHFLAKCTKTVALPMQTGISSLNLATSVSAALYAIKQKMI